MRAEPDEEVSCVNCGSHMPIAECEYTGDAEEAEWICKPCQDEAELHWFREREPLVHELIEGARIISTLCTLRHPQLMEVANAVRDFEVGG